MINIKSASSLYTQRSAVLTHWAVRNLARQIVSRDRPTGRHSPHVCLTHQNDGQEQPDAFARIRRKLVVLNRMIAHRPSIVHSCIVGGYCRPHVLHVRPEQGIALRRRPNALVRLQKDNGIGRDLLENGHVFERGCGWMAHSLVSHVQSSQTYQFTYFPTRCGTRAWRSSGTSPWPTRPARRGTPSAGRRPCRRSPPRVGTCASLLRPRTAASRCRPRRRPAGRGAVAARTRLRSAATGDAGAPAHRFRTWPLLLRRRLRQR